jgi:hypothetical protein
LYRYSAGEAGKLGAAAKAMGGQIRTSVGRCKLNSVDPQLESRLFSNIFGGFHYLQCTPFVWFQTLTLEYQVWFQNVPFKVNLRRFYASGCVIDGSIRVNRVPGAFYVTPHSKVGRGGCTSPIQFDA